MSNLRRFLVSDEEQVDTLRLDKVLAEMLAEELSREQLKRLILEEAVQVNGRVVVKPAYALKAGDEVVLNIPELKPIALVPQDIPLDVVYEDEDLLVINKPRGMLTHPTGREVTGTLVNALLHHCAGGLSGLNGEIRPGIVHRLDRETSGLLVVAKHDRAHRGLSEQLQVKTMRREYQALVQGVFKTESGTVNAPIGRNPKHRDQMMISETGRAAVTHWQLEAAVYGKYSRLRLKLETGRTHQIRVHLASIGHPVIGDPLYGSGLEKILHLEKMPGFGGQLLQAVCLSFVHPIQQKSMTFEIPPESIMDRVWRVLSGEPEETAGRDGL